MNKTSIDRKLIEAFKTYIKIFNKEPSNYNELTNFNNLLSSISKTYDVTYDQINEQLIRKYKNLLNP